VRSLVIFEPSFESEALPKDNEKFLRAREVFWRELEPAYTVARSGDLHSAMRLGVEIVFGLGRGGFETLDPRVQEVFLDNAHTMIPDLEAPAPEPLTKAELGMVTCPTLICCGERTHAQYQLMAESTLNGLPNGSIRRFAGFGHGAPVQAPSHFAEVVLDFVDAVPV
jgi:pimeloyl-ACP methyl ester carboxylesterase